MTGYPTSIAEIRRLEFPQLEGRTYLDHAGSQIPPVSLVKAFAHDLNSNVYGNPHSENLPAAETGKRVDETRLRALQFFNADPEEYSLIFVANATAAIKLVAESFRDYISNTHEDNREQKISWMRRRSKLSRRESKSRTKDFHYLYHKDCHTSLVGIRELSTQHRCFLSDDQVENWINSPSSGNQPLTLFAYPGQSNMTGRRLPSDWPIRSKSSSPGKNSYTLLDAAALATTKELQISTWKPDFVAISFYKIFGFPDLGALLVRRSTAAHIMNARRYFGGGTVEMVISLDDQWHAKKNDIFHHAHEDGTLPFHNIIALSHAMDAMKRVYGGIASVSQVTQLLTRELYVGLAALRHYNNAPVIKIYKDEQTEFGNPHLQGATVTFTVLKATGEAVGFKDVETAADKHNIYIRSGALCNPGGVATYLGWSGEHLRQAYEAGHRCSNPKQSVQGRTTGVVRASLGACSSQDDVAKLIAFIRETYVESNSRLNLPLNDMRVSKPVSKSVPRPLATTIARLGGSDENIISTSTPEEAAPAAIIPQLPTGSIAFKAPKPLMDFKNDHKTGTLFNRIQSQLRRLRRH